MRSAQCEATVTTLDVIEGEIELRRLLDEDQRAESLTIANRCPVYLRLTPRS